MPDVKVWRIFRQFAAPPISIKASQVYCHLFELIFLGLHMRF